MNAQSIALNSGVSDPGYRTRPFYWSVWRELWENRSIYVAPLIVAVVQIFALAISTIGMAERRRAVLLLDDPLKQRAAIEAPYDVAAMMMIFVVFIVGVFYCLDALHGERRDRSILFWKSLPVSDRTTVDRKSTRLNSSHLVISYAVFCLKKKKTRWKRDADDTHCRLGSRAYGCCRWSR